MYYVYGIYNQKHDKIYVGETDDLDSRLQLHNSKFFKHSYTSRFDGKWILIYSEEHPDRATARQREKELKSYRGRQFVKTYIPKYK